MSEGISKKNVVILGYWGCIGILGLYWDIEVILE